MGRKCRIAGLNVNVETQNKKLLTQSEKYAFDFRCEPDINVNVNRDIINKFKEKSPSMSFEIAEYLITGQYFYRRLLDFDGFMIHSSAIEYNGRAYMFSAPCGTGKSTHVDFWKQKLGDKVQVINDDKPAIRLIDGTFYCCGTPWSGKTDLSSNIMVPVGALVFIERSENNTIREIKSGEILKRFFPQTVRPATPEAMGRLLDLFESMLAKVPVYVLGAENNIKAAEYCIENIVKNNTN